MKINLTRYFVALFMIVSGLVLVGCMTQQVTLTFNTSGGSRISSITVTQGVVIEDIPIAVRTGYTFEGWYLEPEFTNAFDPALAIVRHMTVYAKWSINQYTLSFESNSDVVIAPLSIEFNSLIGTLPTPTKVGHTFDGWYLEPGLNNETNFTRMPASSFTLYAKWIPFQYNVTFYRLNGTVLRTEIINHGQTLTAIPNVPIITGKNGTWDVTNFTNITQNVAVHPVYVWKIYTVTFLDALGVPYGTQQVQHGEFADPLVPTPSKTGHTFEGYSETLTTFEITNDIDIFVVFMPLVFEVVFYDEAGGALTIENVVWGGVAIEPDYDAPAGYTFISWDTDFTNVTSDLDINPVLEKNDYDIVLHASDGVFSNSLNILTVTAEYEAIVGVLETPTRTGYTFAGWYDNPSFTGTPFVFSPSTFMPLDGKILYAKWTEEDTTITVSGHYIFDKEIITDYQILTGVMESDGANVPFTTTDVVDGSFYSPIVSFEGYQFVKFVYNSIEYFELSDVLEITENLSGIEVYYKRVILTINFLQVPSEGGSSAPIQEDAFYVHYNNNFPGPNPIIIVVAPYTAIWDRTIFNNVRSNIEVRAFYYQSGVQTITFIDGGSVKYLAVNLPGSPDQIITGESLLWSLNHPGRRFIGWFTALSGGTQITIEQMKFSYFTGSQEIYARWVDLDAFTKPTAIEVITYETDAFSISWTLTPAQIENTLPLGFNIDLNGFVIFVDIADLVVDGTLFTLNVQPLDDLHSLFASMFAPGTHTIAIQAIGDDENHIDGDYSDTSTFSVDSDYEGDITGSVVYDYFIVEDITIAGVATKRYVFYANMTYNFATRYSFVITSGNEYVTTTANSITTLGNVGNFTFSITDNNDPLNPVVYNYEGRVVANINQFALGSNLSTYIQESSGSNYLSPIVSDYLVGYRNNFYFTLRIRDNNGVLIALENVMMIYEFYLNGATEALTQEQLTTYVTFEEGNIMKFSVAAEGHTFKVVMRPRYQALQMQVDDLEFEITINDAHNVFTNIQLRSLFSNFDVRTLNIHTNIEAALAASQKNADGSPKNLTGNPVTGNYYGNVYGRASASISGDHVVINGNYMTINGSNLPHSNKDSGSGVLGYSAAFEVINVQIAIFFYDVYNSAVRPAWENTADQPQTKYVNDNKITINNLTVLSNTTTPSINYGMSAEEIANQEQLMSRNSGGYNGLMVRNGSSVFNNVIIGYALLPYFNTAFGTVSGTEVIPIFMELNYNKAYDSWANSVYLWGATGVAINNSYIGQSGGASIHVVDPRRAGGVYNPTVILDGNTVIDNWISGDEAWFRAYAMSVVALGLKATVEDAVNGLGKTIIKEIINPITGLPSEMINLIMLTQAGSATTYDEFENPITGAEYSIMLTDEIGSTVLDRVFDFLSIDPRVQSGNFMFAVGHLSSTNSFMAAVTEGMMTLGLSQSDSINLAYIAGFYNLTMTQAYQVYGATLMHGLTLPQAVTAVMGPTHIRPAYLEVITQVPIFSGNSTVIIEIFDQE